MSNKFVVSQRPEIREDRSVTMSIRMPRELQEQYDEIALKSNRSRNGIMVMALEYAARNLVLTAEE